MVVSFESQNLASELNHLAERLRASTVQIGSDRASMGIVHSLDGEDIEEIDPARQFDRKSFIPNLNSQKWIVADLQLAPGNSGGPLANVKGEVIGINTAIAGGLALAIPTQEVEHFLISPHRLMLGVTMRPVLVPVPRERIISWLVLEVAFESLAMSAGLKRGDIIISLDGTFFRTPEQFARCLWKKTTGDRLLIEFLRDGKRYEQSIVVGNPR